MTHSQPEPIRTDGSNAFAHLSMTERVPNILQEVIDRNPDYPASIKKNVRALRDAIANDAPLDLFDPPAPDYDCWRQRLAAHNGDSWLDAEWFFAEMFAYRHLLAACRYWTTRRDPFRPVKKDEIESEALQTTVAEALTQRHADPQAELQRSLLGALWGNRMDLSMKGVAAQGTDANEDHLLVNDISVVAEDLLAEEPGDVHIIMDNAGTEEAFDLALAAWLLGENVARTVTLHVKAMPVLVSDVVGEDVFWLLNVMDRRNGPLSRLAIGLRQHLKRGRLQVVPDVFWNTADALTDLPVRLQRTFKSARLVIAKGDANYRRTTNDAIWPETASWGEAAGAVPAPFLALRTIKSDTLVGVDSRRVHALDRMDDAWRTKGTYGVAQYAP